jgi:two-component system, chemotaxis family, protein-glutamate methylesterase/glutaminase
VKKNIDLNSDKYKCIVIGISAGGMKALSKLLPSVPMDFPLPILIVQHIHKSSSGFYTEFYDTKCSMNVKVAESDENIKVGNIYFAPPDRHLQIENGKTLLLTKCEKVNYSRPSIDVLFDSASNVYKNKLIGIILTGANVDGTHGVETIKQNGGLTIAQNPEDAEYPFMPQAAINAGYIDLILTLDELCNLFNECKGK